MKSDWERPELAQQYAAKLDQVDWYEHEVNMRSLMQMMPDSAAKILDFGSGPGQFTAQLSQKYEITGADASQAMIDIARASYPAMRFLTWDGQSAFPSDETFDVIFTKLTLHFVADLNRFAREAAGILADGGSIVASVPHPYRTITKADGRYVSGGTYLGPIGQYGMSVTMIHRGVQAYIDPFLNAGFHLDALDEPVPTTEQAATHDLPVEDAELPKRFNFRLVKHLAGKTA